MGENGGTYCIAFLLCSLCGRFPRKVEEGGWSEGWRLEGEKGGQVSCAAQVQGASCRVQAGGQARGERQAQKPKGRRGSPRAGACAGARACLFKRCPPGCSCSAAPRSPTRAMDRRSSTGRHTWRSRGHLCRRPRSRRLACSQARRPSCALTVTSKITDPRWDWPQRRAACEPESSPPGSATHAPKRRPRSMASTWRGSRWPALWPPSSRSA